MEVEHVPDHIDGAPGNVVGHRCVPAALKMIFRLHMQQEIILSSNHLFRFHWVYQAQKTKSHATKKRLREQDA